MKKWNEAHMNALRVLLGLICELSKNQEIFSTQISIKKKTQKSLKNVFNDKHKKF